MTSCLLQARYAHGTRDVGRFSALCVAGESRSGLDAARSRISISL
ncbi:hypothetical protein [Streptomyces buecherae]